MHTQIVTKLPFLLFLFLLPLLLFGINPSPPWIIYYGNAAKEEAFDPYNPIVLDSQNHPPLTRMLKQKKEILAYLNLGEVSESQQWFPLAGEKKLLIKENSLWKGDWSLDIRDPIWKKWVIEEMIPPLISQGFTGLLLDQLDIPLALETQDPEKYKGMKEAAIDLVKTIRLRLPSFKLMLNRAYDLLQELGKEIDYELAETLYSSYDPQNNRYFIRPKKEFELQVDLLKKANQQFPHLILFSLDYWDPQDTAMYKKIASIERKEGFRPYVSTIQLNQITEAK